MVHHIITLRKKHSLSQQEVADMLGVSRATYSDIERANREGSAIELKKLAELFEVSMENLLEPEWISTGLQSVPTDEVIFDSRKLKNILLYILETCGGRPNLGETVLYKLLYFIDFDMFDKYGSSVTGLSYVNQQYGPVPLQQQYNAVIEAMIDQGYLKIFTQEYFGKKQKRYVALTNHEMGVLNEREKSMVDEVLAKLAHMSATDIKNYVHLDIPWRETKEKDIIPYHLVFERQIPFSQRDRSRDMQVANVIDVEKELGPSPQEEQDYYSNL